MIEVAWRLAQDRLKTTAEETNHYGIGFVGVHQGKTGSFIFVDWWADENELHHHVYVATSGHPDEFGYVTPSGLTACAWDLRVLCFEREAWVKHVLQGDPEPDVDAYLGMMLDTEA
ncbi:isochorismatase [Billgrantia azerbaijanica]|nr:isochorismatase [Halomonas azerbaijanica]